MQSIEEPRLYLRSSLVRRESRWMGRDLCAKHVLVQVKFRREKKPNILSNIFNKARLIILIYPLSSQIKQDDLSFQQNVLNQNKFHKINAMIGRSGLTRQAECTNEYSSIAEEGTSSMARLKNLTHHQSCALDGSREPWCYART